jgi:hypothetical protein
MSNISTPKFLLLFSLALLLAATSISACTSDDSDSEDQDSATHVAAVLTGGFSIAWRDLNHRISLWGFSPEATTAGTEAEVAAWQPEVNIAFIGGDWTVGIMATDVPVYDYRATIISGPKDRLGFFSGRMNFELEAPDFNKSALMELNLQEIGLQNFSEFAVFVNGLEFITDVPQNDNYTDEYEPSLGYTSSGMGAAVEDVTVSGSRLSFNLNLDFPLAPATPTDRPPMQEAIKEAILEGAIYFLVVGYVDGALSEIAVDYRVSSPFGGGAPYVALHPDASTTAAQTETDAELADGAIGLQAFSFDLFPGDPADYGHEMEGFDSIGEYIMEYALLIDNVERSDDGLLTANLEGYCSNEGLVVYSGLVYDFSATAVYLQIEGAQMKTVTASGTFYTEQPGEIDTLLEK